MVHNWKERGHQVPTQEEHAKKASSPHALRCPSPNGLDYSCLIASNCLIFTFLSYTDTRSAVWQEHKLKPGRTITGMLASEVKASQQYDSGTYCCLSLLQSEPWEESLASPAKSEKYCWVAGQDPHRGHRHHFAISDKAVSCHFLLWWAGRKDGVGRANSFRSHRRGPECWLHHWLAVKLWACYCLPGCRFLISKIIPTLQHC